MQVLSAPWPEYKTLLSVESTKLLNIGRRASLAWAVARSRRFRALVDESVTKCPWVRPAMDRHPILFRPLMSMFLDPRLSLRQLFTYYSYDLEFTSTHINRALPNFFPLNLKEPLWINFFQELGAQPMPDGNWDVPLTLQARKIADAPSRKRAMYKRRFTLIAGLRDEVGTFLTKFIPAAT